ncbi:MAG: nucleotidyltransferase [Elusimicrobia bacterium]|nr:nucleotidyltransferase [Elusimicrobiota bacterium]MBU2614827.1 nucleotidyltransferase [Elusimicrobiota bacterium]
MNFEKVFKLLISEFQNNKVEFALIGGHALYYSKVSRTTLDIDFMVLLDQSDLVNNIMKKYGYKVLQKTENVANYLSDFTDLGQVDFLFAHRKYALNMLSRAKYKDVFGQQIKVIGPEDIIGLKIQAISNDPQRYHQDIADIEQVIKWNKESLNFKLVEEYFKLFNRGKELKEIVKRIK